MTRCGPTLGLTLVVLATACSGPPGGGTRDLDVKTIRDLEANWVRDIGTKNVDMWMKYYADDVNLLMPNAPAINGKENAKRAIAPLLKDPTFALRFQSTRIEVSKGGDLAYTVGSYEMTESDAVDHKAVTDKGKYVTVYKKQSDGSWKATADIINSDLPVQGATYR